MKSDLNNLDSKISDVKAGLNSIVSDPNLYYDELSDSVKTVNGKYNIMLTIFDKNLDIIKELINKKIENPFVKHEILIDSNTILNCVNDLNAILKEYKTLIFDHNTKTDNFEKIVSEYQEKLEKHFIQSEIQTSDYVNLTNEIQAAKITLGTIEKDISDKQFRYQELENKISKETLGAEAFNNKLSLFLGHNEISLAFDEELKGYKIKRYGIQEAKNLSEGEKTAIAFIYFMTKIKENGNKINDSILVIDDPVSSFDSNKLFSAYSYIKNECQEAKQLFVLTHNYNFYSSMLEWFSKRKKKDPVSGNSIPAYKLYRIETKFENDFRYSVLRNAGDSLKQSSEYDYIFYTVYSYKDSTLNKNDYIFCGNVCRKLVESFLSFKFPKQRGDIKALLDKAFTGPNDYLIKDSIYKFVNIYSHSRKINVFEELDTDIMDTNNQRIVNDILAMIKRLDENHYNDMVSKVKKEID